MDTSRKKIIYSGSVGRMKIRIISHRNKKKANREKLINSGSVGRLNRKTISHRNKKNSVV